MSNAILMCANNEVMVFNLSVGYYKVLNEDLLPLPLKGVLLCRQDYTSAIQDYIQIIYPYVDSRHINVALDLSKF